MGRWGREMEKTRDRLEEIRGGGMKGESEERREMVRAREHGEERQR